MAEYITKKQVIEWFRCYAHEDIPIRFEDLEFDIQHMIPEDVAPVRHGRWRFCGSGRWNDVYECDNCGKMATNNSDFCPNCGANMRGINYE